MNEAKDTYAMDEIAQALMLVTSSVSRRAKRESWPSQPRAGRGGGKAYPLATLPEDVRAAITLAQARAAESATATAPRQQLSDVVVPDWSWSKAKAKLRLVAEWRAHTAQQAKFGVNMKNASSAFLLAFESGQLLPQLRELLGQVSMPTLYRWDKSLRENGRDLEALADKRGGWANGRKKGLGQIAQEAQQAFLAAYLRPNRPSLTLAHRAMALVLEHQGLPVPTYSSVRRFFERFDSYNHDLVVFHREGMKALDDKVGPFLSRDDKILQVGDVLVSDGQAWSKLTGYTVTVNTQEIRESGLATVVSGGYVDVELSRTYLTIINVNATPKGASNLSCVTDFDNLDPTFIRVYLFDPSTGAPGTGPVSYDVYGQ